MSLHTNKHSGWTSWILAFTLALPLSGCVAPPDAHDGEETDEDVESAELALSGACTHDKCTEGGPLDASCSTAAADICAVDPYCCNVQWDWICVNEVASVTNSLVCAASSGTCSHPLCSTGSPLVSGCDGATACTADICTVDPYCCDVSWDRICVDEVASVCGKSCDTSGCDLDGDGDPTPACGGSDADDSCIDEDLHLTECADDLIGFTGSIIEAVNAIPVPLSSRTLADVLTCPVDTGVGEQSHVNIFSYVGPLDTSCNRFVLDDCTDPDRLHYWISVVDDRRPGADPYSFRVIWGDEDRVAGTDFPLDYYYYGSCSPDPWGYDNPAAGIPRLLTPVHDNDGDGVISVCPGQNHVYLFKFYTFDGSGAKVYVEKDDIAHLSAPFLVPAWVPLPGLTMADHLAENSAAYVGVNVTLKDPQGTVITALVESNSDGLGAPTWVQWKSAQTCGAP